jgi:D-alanine--poly(phosphoribitol) ligase subunit 1
MSAPRSVTLDRLLATGLAIHPDKTALKRQGRSYTFRELDRFSDVLAAHMAKAFGVKKGDRVTVIAEKAIEIVIVGLAVWKAGAVYVPTDAKNPEKRTEFILGSIEPALVVSSAALLAENSHVLCGRKTMSYEEVSALDLTAEVEVPAPGLTGEDNAIIIHTSGSTGFPKGAVLQHASVATYFANHNAILEFGPDSISLNSSPFHFDVSIQDTYLPLYFGASVVMHGDLFVSKVMLGLIRAEKITHLIAVSSVLDLISADDALLSQLGPAAPRYVITGGETCDPKLINRWLTHYPDIKLYYGYGPTECNSLCMAYRVPAPDHGRTSLFPIGTIFPGHSAALLAEDGSVIEEPDTVGVLAVSGPQLMRGYWNSPEQTAAVFREIGGKRYYVTGDRCYRDGNGLYCFAGRNDSEVKLRGRRINLNEIRNALLAHERVRYAVVNTVEAGGERKIFGYVHVAEKDDLTHAEVETFVRGRVPDYMLPSYLCISDRVMKTSTGKISEKEITAAVTEAITAAPDRRHLVL